MAPQSENRMSVPASAASLSSMERVLDVAPNLSAPQVDIIIFLPISIQIPPSRSEVPQNAQQTVDTGTEDLPTTEVSQHANPDLPVAISVPLSSSISTNVSFNTSRRADTSHTVDALSKKHGVSLVTPVLSIMKLNVKPGSRCVCTSVTLECIPDSRYGAIPYYNAQEDSEATLATPTLHSPMETVAYTDLDATEEYWPLEYTQDGVDNSNQPDVPCPRPGDAHDSNTLPFENTCDDVDNSKKSVTPCPRQGHAHNTNTPIHRIIWARTSQHIFHVSVHGIR